MDLSSVHRAMLAGPSDVLAWTREGLKQHMRTLVAAGLFHSDAEARRECMLRPKLLDSHRCGGTSSARRRCWRRAAAWTTCSQHAAMVVHFKLRIRACCYGSCQGVLLQSTACMRGQSSW